MGIKKRKGENKIMNKLFNKIAALSVGLAMAIGVGVAIGSKSDVRSVKAADEIYKTALFGSSYNSASIGDYTSSWAATNNGFTVSLQNFNNNQNGWNYVKCGRKNNASVGTITTSAAIDQAVTKVSVTIDALTASKINSIKLYTSTNGSSWTEKSSFTKATGAQENSTALTPTANLYYKLEFDCASGSSNGLITVSRVDFYKQQSAASTYTVTYAPNGADSGSVPVDSHSYTTSDNTATVLGNTGSLAKTGYTFNGWNSAANGQGTHYAVGSTFTVSENTTLFAEWSINQYTLTYNANGGSGTLPEGGTYDYGSKQDVAEADGLTNGNLVFSSWNTQSNGEGDTYLPGSKITIEANTTLYAQWSQAGSTLTRVENESELSVGDEIAIVAAGTGTKNALSTEQNENNRGVASVSVANDYTFSVTNDVQMITLGKSNNNWTFNVGDGYLYAASSSKNYLRTRDPLGDANAEWTISISSGEATITAQGSNTRNILMYNSSNTCFSCYESGQTAVSIYKVAEPERPITSYSMTSGSVYAKTGDTQWTLSGFAFSVTYQGDSEPTDVTANTTFAVTESVPTPITQSGSMTVHVIPTYKGTAYTQAEATITASLLVTSSSTLIPGTNGYSDAAEQTATAWTDATKSGTVYLNSITYTPAGGSNVGKYYTNGTNWRFYTPDTLTITAQPGYMIDQITFTFTYNNNGKLLDPNDSTRFISSGTAWAPTSPARAFTFVVDGMSGTSSGTIRFTQIEVVFSEPTTPTPVITAPVSEIKAGDTGTFAATVYHASNPTLAWSSADSSIVRIDNASTGAYTALTYGDVEITVVATASNGSGTDKLVVSVSSNGTITIAQANTICAALPNKTSTGYRVTISGYITNLDATNKGSGSENAMMISDFKVGGSGNSIEAFGIYSDNALRGYAILNGTVALTGYLENYNGTYELTHPELVSYTDAAIEYAHDSYAALTATCEAYGPQGITSSQWTTLEGNFNDLDEYAQAKLSAATSSDDNEDIANWITRYTIIVEVGGQSDFMSLGLTPGVNARTNVFGNDAVESSGPTLAIIVASILSLTAVGGYFVIRKRKFTK